MTSDGQLQIDIVLDDGTVVKGFANIRREAKKTEESFSFRRGIGSLFNLRNAIIGAVTAFGGFRILQTVTRAAIRQEEAINKLNTALRLTGRFTEETSKSLQRFADDLQRSTRFGNELVLETAGLIQTLGNLDEQGLQRATKAALDFATATGRDARTAAELLGRAAQGQISAFTRYGIVVQQGATNAETLNNALRALETRFGGASEASINTFAGALAQFQNNLGEVQKAFGGLIQASPAIIGVISEIGKIFADLSDNLRESFSENNFIDDFVKSAVEFSFAITDLLVRPLEIGLNVITLIINGFKSAFQGLIVAIASGASRLVSFFRPNSELARGLKTFVESSKSVLNDFVKDTEESFRNLGDTSLSDGLTENLERIRIAANETREAVQSIVAPVDDGDGADKKFEDTLGGISGAFKSFSEGFRAENQRIVENSTESFKAIGAAAVQNLGRGVGGAFAAFGKALKDGDNALKAFKDAFLRAIGEQAVALGTSFILEGTARLILGQGNGAPLIAAGAALATFGGVLGATGGGAGSPATGTSDTTPVTSVQPVEETRQGNEITVNFNGDILEDSPGLGQRIAQAVNAEIDRNGSSVLRFT
jgi:hypothetical protein